MTQSQGSVSVKMDTLEKIVNQNALKESMVEIVPTTALVKMEPIVHIQLAIVLVNQVGMVSAAICLALWECMDTSAKINVNVLMEGLVIQLQASALVLLDT